MKKFFFMTLLLVAVVFLASCDINIDPVSPVVKITNTGNTGYYIFKLRANVPPVYVCYLAPNQATSYDNILMQDVIVATLDSHPDYFYPSVQGEVFRAIISSNVTDLKWAYN